ncbi:MAG TPA: hypothetical protein VJ720_01385, partial [Chitinophaga sp.]|nr:hypothetical protein [Chitinophaga sp.]
MKNKVCFPTLLLLICCSVVAAQVSINRTQLVQRHNVINHRFDSLSSLTLGNGGFAFTADITGLQTFPEAYANGVPLGTQSGWGWHSFKDTAGYRFEESLKTYHLHNRDITYAVQWNQQGRSKAAADWFRQNVHRLQLGNIGFEIVKKDGSVAVLNDIQQVDQQLDLWNGLLSSRFSVEGIPVEVSTVVHPYQDIISVSVHSALLREGRLRLRVRFPYPTGAFTDAGVNRNDADKHTSGVFRAKKYGLTLYHELDDYRYVVKVTGSTPLTHSLRQKHDHLLQPASGGSDRYECSIRFDRSTSVTQLPSYELVRKSSQQYWQRFWQEGGAVDFSGSTDTRAPELERRIILSQYLMAVQCADSMPPQETGLTYNSWFGKPHLEMHWWHAVHFALWNRPALLEKSLAWYVKAADKATALARRQGYDGLRWQKMTDPEGNESPSSVGAFLIWQQPHFIYMTELLYRHDHKQATLDKYKELVF